MKASLPLHPGWRRASKRSPSQPKPEYDSLALTDAVRSRSSSYEALREAFRTKLLQYRHLHFSKQTTYYLQCVCRLFPRVPAQSQPRAWQSSEVQLSVADMWKARQRMRSLAGGPRGSFRACFQAWVRHRDFQKAYKTLKKRGREARRAVLEGHLEQAKEAVARGDHGGLHRVIRALAPKTRRAQVHISWQGRRDADLPAGTSSHCQAFSGFVSIAAATLSPGDVTTFLQLSGEPCRVQRGHRFPQAWQGSTPRLCSRQCCSSLL